MLRSLLSEMRFRIRALVARDATERELDAEIRHHLAYETDRLVRAGAAPEEAARQARITFGAVEDIKDATRDARGVTALEHLARDVRYAVRTLALNPVYTCAAIFSLALGIGANTAMFSAVDSLLLRPLPVARPNELVTFEVDFPDGYRQYNLGFSDFRSIGDLHEIVADASGTSWAESFDVRSADGAPLASGGPTRVSIVSGNYFRTLGLSPARGRFFGVGDDGDDVVTHPVAVVSNDFWQRAFAGAPDVVGRLMRVNGTTLTIIGVASPHFVGDWVGWPTDIWVTTSMISALHPESEGRPRNRYQYKVLARLQPSVSVARAQAAADLLYSRLIENPADGSGLSPNARLVVRPAGTGYSPQRDAFARPLTALLAIVGIVLLIACANLASLQLARAVARERELALRIALGAGRGRLVRQLMTESVILALGGAAGGLIVAGLGMHVLESLARAGPADGVTTNTNPLAVDLALRFDARVLVFTLGLSVVASILFGLAPAIRGSRLSLLPALGIGGARTMHSGGSRFRSTLVIVQVALSMLLVICTGLFVRTLRNLESESLGFDRSRLLMVWALPGHTRQSDDKILRMWERLEARLSAVTGVQAVALSVEGLLSGRPGGGPLVTRAGSTDTVRVGETMTVSPNFFTTVKQPIRDGRDFTAFDTDSAAKVIVINERLAERLFGKRVRAVGQSVRFVGPNTLYKVVGVVGDARQQPRTAAAATVYYPAGQNLRRLGRGLCILLRANGSPGAFANSVRRELQRIEPTLPILAINDMDEQLDRLLFRERLIASLAVGFAVLAVVLSSVGLFGVVAYSTSRRTREIGVRMALGAPRSGVLGSVLAGTMRLTAGGVVAGLCLSIVANRAIAGLLFGVGTSDAVTLIASSLVFAVVAAVAGFLPAYRASRVSPMVALRSE